MVEPIEDAHKYIRDYFSKYGYEESIINLYSESLLEFNTKEIFDIVVAEGFIYTIQPTISWIKKVKEFLSNDGLFILSFYDLYGGFFELLQKAIYNSVKRNGNFGEGINTVKNLFLNKWNSVTHTRSIDSWFMDVMENPFVRLKYFIDPVDLLKDMHENQMKNFSAWPVYRNPHSVDWIKKPFTKEEELSSSIKFIHQNRLSHFLGNKCLLTFNNDAISVQLKSIIEITDDLIDHTSPGNCLKAINLLKEIKISIQSNIILTDDKIKINGLLDMIIIVFELLKNENFKDLIKFCQTNKDFIDTWGSPNHNVIFQKD